MVKYSGMQGSGQGTNKRHDQSGRISGVVRNSSPVAPENSALADELRRVLKGKPTVSGFNRSLKHEIVALLAAVFKVVLVAVLCVAFGFGGFGAGMLLGYVSMTKPLSISDITQTDEVQTSFVYDSEGNVIARLTGSQNVDRIYIPISEVRNTYLEEAVISIEDERFYEHSGIDIRRIGSAVLSALANGGSATHGGSTITQQTVKLISGNDQHSTSRKIQEWFAAMSLEQELSKDEIMELYLNLAPMGNNYVGVQAAAQNYFGKNASELNLAECAFLAGLPKSPSYYNPLRESGRRNALRRQRIVLSKMFELGYITEEEYQNALNTELLFQSNDEQPANEINSYFCEYAISEVINDVALTRGISNDLAATIVYNRGYHIYTTLEPNVQAVLDEAFSTRDLFQQDPTLLVDYPEKPQAGMVVINVQTGAIAGMQGGYGPKPGNMVLNRATQAYRSTGSSIKPIIDYAPAIELGIIAPGMIYVDEESHLDPNNPAAAWPLNADRSYAGPMTIRRAVATSKNTIAVKVWYDVGGDTALWFLRQEGIDMTAEGSYPAQAIGSFTTGITPLQMCGAFNTLASGGTYTEPYAYTQVLDSNDNVVLTKTPERHRVYSAETSYIMSDILEDVITNGTATGTVSVIHNADGEYIATSGKTGTTDANLDKWFCGYTPYYCGAVWYGYDNRLRQTLIPTIDKPNANRIWYYVMSRIHQDLPGASWERPETVVEMEVCESGYFPSDYCREAGTTVTDLFVVGSYLAPTEDNVCPIHTAPEEELPQQPGIEG